MYKSRRQLISATESLLRMIYHVDFAFHSIWLYTLFVKENAMCFVHVCDIIITCYMFWKNSRIIGQVGFIFVGEMENSFNQRGNRVPGFCLVLCRLIFIDTEVSSVTTIDNKKIIDINPHNEIMLLRRIIF